MNTNRDMLFKVGLGLQLLLIPVAFLWHFSPEANYYDIVVLLAFLAITALFFWPQAIQIRAKRLASIKAQFVLVLLILSLSWAAYGYFHSYVETQIAHSGSTLVIYSV